MKHIFFLTLICTLLCASCSKKSDTTDSGNNSNNKEIKPADLTAYYIAGIRSDNALAAIYFVNESGTIKAYSDLAASRRIVPVSSVSDNTLKLDVSNNGSKVYTFSFKKDASGNITLTDATMSGTDGVTLQSAQMYKVADAPDFQAGPIDGQIFTYTKSSDGGGVYLYFETESRWKYDAAPTGPSQLYSYYAIGNGIGWKNDDAPGGASMGISVPDWGGNGPAMLVKSNIDKIENSRVHIAKKL